MPMLRGWACLLAGLLAAGGSAAAAEEEPGGSIRAFDLATLESLGRQIYEQDQIAAKGTDALFATGISPRDLMRDNVKGWLVVRRENGYLVRFVHDVDGALSVAHDVRFDSPQSRGTVLPPEPGPLPDEQAAQYRARSLAVQSIKTYCARSYNTVVLPDPDGTGWLAYALAATDKRGEVLVGGHVRVTTSPDGRTAERVDQLSRSCLVLREEDIPAHGKPVGLTATHLLGPTPIETHVYLSLLHHQPLFIGTPDRTIWKVEGGKITKLPPPGKK